MVFLLAAAAAGAQTPGEWAWMGGSSTINGSGVYGTEYSFAASNMPGARSDAVTWTGADGRFWLFGGNGYDAASTLPGKLNDLWVFDASQGSEGEWAWMGGSNTRGALGVYGTEYSFASSNWPGARYYGTTWTDTSGRLWLFGGTGCNSSECSNMLNDLWVFDTTKNSGQGEWAWMGGSSTAKASGTYGTEYSFASSNVPGARNSGTGWVGSDGRLWLFGGYGYDSTGSLTVLSDLWVFDTTLNSGLGEWAWMGGSSTALSDSTGLSGFGVYGAKYVYAATNSPGGRTKAAVWTDSDGRLWMFGGSGYDEQGLASELNDTWVFDPSQGSEGEWAWMSGSKTGEGYCFAGALCGQAGVYGTLYQYAAANVPGGRSGHAYWADSDGNGWLLGGYGYSTRGKRDLLNDLWHWDASRGTGGEWSWQGGSSLPTDISMGYGRYAQYGIYGTEYAYAATNAPGSRSVGASWTGSDGKLWLFGGRGVTASGSSDCYLNDLWVYDPPVAQTVSFTQPATPVTYGAAAVTLSATGGAGGSAVTFSVLSGPGAASGSNGATLKYTGAGTVVVAADQAGVQGYLQAAEATRTVVVQKAAVAVTASSASVAYGAAAPAITASYSGWVNSDSSSVLTTAPACATTYTKGSAPGTYASSCSSAAAANYSFSYAAGTVTVAKATQTISFTQPAAKVTYGAAALTLTATASSGLAVGFSSTTTGVCTVSGAKVSFVGAGVCTIQAAQTGNTNYAAATAVSHSIVVARAPLTVTASSPAVAYGAAVPTISPSYSGWKGTNTTSVLTAKPTCLTAYYAGRAPGSYATTCSGATAANYYMVYVAGKVTVSKAAQTIAFAQPATPVSYGAAAKTATATASSGLAVTVSSTTTAVCTWSSGKVKFVAAGSCTLKATQAGNANYAAATAVTRTITVSKAALTLTASNLSFTKGGKVPALTYTVTGLVNSETAAKAFTGAPKLATTATSSSAVGSYPITIAAGTLKSSNYSFTFKNGTMTVKAASSSVRKTEQPAPVAEQSGKEAETPDRMQSRTVE